MDAHRVARLVGVALLVGSARSAESGTAAPGFVETTVVDGLTAPTAIAFLPDGRLLASREGDHVARASGALHLVAKALVGVARHECLRLTDRGPHRARVEVCGDGDGVPVRRQLEAFTVGEIAGRLTKPQVDEMTVEAGLHQCADDLREGHRVVLGAFEASPGDRLLFRVHVTCPHGFGRDTAITRRCPPAPGRPS